MDIYKNTYDGSEVDLDDMSIHSKRLVEMGVFDLFLKCMEEAGTSLFYMKFLHPNSGWEEQQVAVDKMCEELSDIWNNKRHFELNVDRYNLLNEDEYRLLLLKWFWRFEDLIENQC